MNSTNNELHHIMTTQAHQYNNIIFDGASPDKAERAIIFVHGRGDSGNGMQQMAHQIVNDDKTALVFPKATNATWYPYSFMENWEINQPWLDSALETLGSIVTELNQNNIPNDKIFFLGFSQGACLSLEYVSRNAQKYAGVMVLSGGLIGPRIEKSHYNGDFAGTEIFIGCSDVDFHIPVQRVHDSADVAEELGAKVDKRIYPGMGHLINDDEFERVIEIIRG